MEKRLGREVAVLVVVLAACGGSSKSGGGTTSPTGPVQAVSGTITGLGTVMVDGTAYDTSNAAVFDNTDPANPVATTVDSLQVGQKVTLGLDSAGKATTVAIEAWLSGPIDAGSINPNDPGSANTVANSFTVLGQTVTFTPSGSGATLFVGVSDATQLKDGQMVVVHGSPTSTGAVSATLIVALPSAFYRVTGTTASTDTTAKTFKLGSLTVAYGSAKLVPENAVIKDGVEVEVFSALPPTGTPPDLTLTAQTVAVRRAGLAGQVALIHGPITAVTPVQGQDIPNFTVDGTNVDASKATLAGGATASEIQVGALVAVEGTLDPATGTLLATTIAVIPASTEDRVVLSGPITDFVSPASFVVSGTTVDATSATYTNGSADQLANGVPVAVTGHVSGAVVLADQVVFLTLPQGTPRTLVGRVSGYDPASAAPQPFTLLGISMQLDPAVTFTNGTSAQFVNGALVEVTGSFNGKVFVVTAVRFPQITEVEALRGVISGVTPPTGTPTSFVLNNTTITVTPSTNIVNGPLADGQRVGVVAQPDGQGGTVALTVLVIAGPGAQPGPGPGAGAPRVYPFGPITSFTSISSFVVDNLTIDASAATLLPAGTKPSDLAVDRVIAVTGTFANGIVTASEVVLLH